MKKIIFLILWLASFLAAAAQTAMPQPYLITTDTARGNIALPDSCWQMMADPTGKMTIQEIINANSFQDHNKRINYNIRTYWFRYRLINKMSKEAEIAIHADDCAFINLFIRTDNGKWKHFRTGTEVPWSKRDGLKRIAAIPIRIPADGHILVYERNRYDYVSPSGYELSLPGNIDLSFGFTRTIIQQNYVNNDLHHARMDINAALMAGAYLMVFLIMIYFFIIVRELEFLFFAIYIFMNAALLIHALKTALFTEHPLVMLYIGFLGNILVMFFLMHFIRYFLKTYRRFPLWDKWLVTLSILLVIILSLYWYQLYIFHIDREAVARFYVACFLFIFEFSVLISLILYSRDKDRSIRWMIIAMIPVMAVHVYRDILYILYHIYYIKSGTRTVPTTTVSLEKSLNLIFTISFYWLIIASSGVLFIRFYMLRQKFARQEIDREKDRANLMSQQKAELEKKVTESTSELRRSLDNLKSTQKQLIQSEKMASLGELTAGIAHEIQNPLNFVNNFSEVNKELLEELKAERLKPRAGQATQMEDEIINNVIANEEKILHHGRRADAIVKGMLQHSRGSSGQKELTDINALADEYLKLSYHGMRTKDKSFNATMKTDFDETIGNINIVPQDIGRVLLNLYNNAFYACAELSRNTQSIKLKAKNTNPNPQTSNLKTYDPTVEISTKRVGSEVIIRVRDNGSGIDGAIKDKIFQPFFTTKPTGEGTGLGLSLSYDIIKAHDGEIKVKTTPSEGTEFTVILPINSSSS